jgi:DNA-binding NarL/FixJ family response regulator
VGSEASRGPVRLPISVAAVNDYEIVVEGVASRLRRFPDHVTVRDRIVVGEPIRNGPVDVALYDTYGRVGLAAPSLARLGREPGIRRIALFTLELTPDLVEEGRRHGVTGFVSKTLAAEEIVDGLVQIAAGVEVVADGRSDRPALDELDWPGKDAGLSERESEVLVLLSEGLTNAEIGQALYLGRETIKTHLSRAYRKLGVRNRAEAVRFVVGTGAFARFRPAEEALEEV